MGAEGGVVSIRISFDWTPSTLPTSSIAANLTVVEATTSNGLVYTVPPATGSDPSVV